MSSAILATGSFRAAAGSWRLERTMFATFSIVNLGCKVNRVEADNMTALLLAAGAHLVDLPEAQVVLINTCTVTGEADAKSRKALRRALRKAPQAQVIVCGCGARAHSEQFKETSRRYRLIARQDEAVQWAAELLGLLLPKTQEAVARVGKSFNTRVAVKVQDGCDNRCSYCIVPLARGSARSLPASQVLSEIDLHLKAGVKEIVLTGIDLGSYHEGGYRLAELSEEALKIGDEHRIRLSSIELPNLRDALIDRIVYYQGRLCAHLHIPLQSGSDLILRAMRRRYDKAAYLERIMQIKKRLPSLALSTDVMVGFPGESESDFNETLAVCKELGFCRIHIFRYSKRPGTQAASLPDQVAAEVSAWRAQRLAALSEKLTRADALERLGSEEEVLFERVGRGRSESYYPVRTVSGAKQGKLVTMRFTGFEKGELIAEEC